MWRYRRIDRVCVLLTALGLGACGPEAPVRPHGQSTPPEIVDLAPSIQPGDILIAINGRSVGSRAEAFAALGTRLPEEGPWTIVIDRAGERITLEIDAER